MAKFVCMFALVGMTAGAPQALRVSAGDQDVVVNKIMYSLQPAIDAAIARALSGVSTSSSSRFGGVSAGAGASGQKSVHFQTAGAGGVVYGGQQQSVSSNQYSSSGSSFSASQQSQLIQGVTTALIPSIEAAVSAALARQQAATASQEQALIARIIQVLTPSITTSVRNAMASSYNSGASGYNSGASSYGSGNSLTSLFGDGKSHAVRVATPEFQIAYDEDSADVSSQYNSQSYSGYNSGNSGYNSGSSGYSSGSSSGYSSGSSSGYSSGSSSGSLRNVFGDGKSHNVKVETPEYKIEYNS